jgi:uncharacterized protein (DUF2062 family)
MVFQRRQKRSFLQQVRGFFWPHIGWKRATLYTKHRLLRLPGTPYTIAGGFACGAAISFTPFVGLHFIISAIMAFIIRANIEAALIGTAVGNPWSFPFIWSLVYKTGTWMMGIEGEVTFPEVWTLEFVIEHFLDVFLPMLVASVPIGAVVWFIFYLPLRSLVARYQFDRRRRLAQRNGKAPAALNEKAGDKE